MKTGIAAGILAAMIMLATAQPSVRLPEGARDLMKENGISDSGGVRPLPTAVAPGRFDELSDFSNRLWSTVSDGGSGVISPLSAYIALAMTAGGAKGNTLESFGCLGIGGENYTGISSETGALIDYLTSPSGSTKLNIANSVWIDDSFTVSPEFLQILSKYYSADAIGAKLSESTQAVNSWIEEKTGGLIKDMLDSIDPDTSMLLVNTIYMDAKWKVPFEKEATYEDVFTSSDGELQRGAMMHRTGYISTIDAEGLEGVALPYDDGRLSFVALLPDEGTTTSELIARLSELDIAGLADNAVSERVALSLPKLELSTSLSLKSALCDMGMEKAFVSSADFSGMGSSPDGNLCIGDVLQNAKLRLDEAGTEAAAATVVMVKNTSILIEQPPREISFDRPFVWAVVDSASGAVLFCGEVNSLS